MPPRSDKNMLSKLDSQKLPMRRNSARCSAKFNDVKGIYDGVVYCPTRRALENVEDETEITTGWIVLWKAVETMFTCTVLACSIWVKLGARGCTRCSSGLDGTRGRRKNDLRQNLRFSATHGNGAGRFRSHKC
jgi:hypothetical protein